MGLGLVFFILLGFCGDELLIEFFECMGVGYGEFYVNGSMR